MGRLLTRGWDSWSAYYHSEEGADERVVRLQLFTAAGEAVLTAEVDETGEARVYVGSRDTGPAVVVTKRGIDAWRDGDAVAVVPVLLPEIPAAELSAFPG
jgi:hypothetical protein